MKKVVVLALLLFVCVGSLLAQENDKQKKKSITDSLFRIDQVDVMQKKKRIDLLGLDVPLRFVPITVSKLSSQMLDRKGIVDLMDAVKFLPGIVAKDKQYGQFQQFSIRGQGSAVVMIDGIRDERTLNNNVPYGDLAAVESMTTRRSTTISILCLMFLSSLISSDSSYILPSILTRTYPLFLARSSNFTWVPFLPLTTGASSCILVLSGNAITCSTI